MAERKVVLLRLRPAHYEALRRWATDEFRSVNAQLEYVVQRALRDAGRLPRGTPASPADGDAEGDADETRDAEEGTGEKPPS